MSTDFSVDFCDLPYDVLLNTFLYSPGIRTVAALQGTCKRCYEIGSEEDYIWKLQCRRFYPSLFATIDEASYSFVGYYYHLRGLVSEKKNRALADLINRIHSTSVASGESDVYYDWHQRVTRTQRNAAAVAESNESILSNTSEINLSKGVCMGVDAGKLFGETKFSWMLDTLDLSGQRLRGEGLEAVATCAKQGRLPFLRNLGLRQDKLGLDAARSGAALLQIVVSCGDTLQAIDLTDNSIGGVTGVKQILSNGNLRLPSRFWLDQNYLGTAGAIFVLESATSQLRGANSNSAPALLSLTDCGIGFDHSTVNAANDAVRSKIEQCVELVVAANSYWTAFQAVASRTAADRRAARHRREEARNKRIEQQMAAGGGDPTTSLVLQAAVRKTNARRAADENNSTNNNAVVGTLALGKGTSCNIPALQNAMPASLGKVLEKAVQEKKNRGDEAKLVKMVQAREQGAVLNLLWPPNNGPEPSGGCCIC